MSIIQKIQQEVYGWLELYGVKPVAVGLDPESYEQLRSELGALMCNSSQYGPRIPVKVNWRPTLTHYLTLLDMEVYPVLTSKPTMIFLSEEPLHSLYYKPKEEDDGN